MNNLEHLVSDKIAENSETLTTVKNGLNSIKDMSVDDILVFVVAIAVLVVGILIVLQIAKGIVKTVLFFAVLLIVGFIFFGFDPNGYGSYLYNYVLNLWNTNVAPLLSSAYDRVVYYNC